jgi:hypothetical protein
MVKTRRNRSRRGGQEQSTPSSTSSSMSVGGRSRRRRGGQYGPAPVTTNASNLLSDIGSGAQKALDKTKEGFSWAYNKVFSSQPNPSYGGSRKRRGGTKGFDGVIQSQPASVNAPQSLKGGSRRKRRGGQVVGFDGDWKEYGSVGGSRRRRRKH